MYSTGGYECEVKTLLVGRTSKADGGYKWKPSSSNLL